MTPKCQPLEISMPYNFRDNISHTELLDIYNLMKLHDIRKPNFRILPDAVETPEAFVALLTAPTTKVLLSQHGIYYLTNINVDPFVAVAHCFYIDGKLFGRAREVYQLTQWALEKYNLKRIESYIPTYNKPASYLLRKAGYTFEGVMRKRILYGGKLEDIGVYAYFR